MAPELPRHLAPGGVAILSGLFADQEREVLASYAPLALKSRVALGDWITAGALGLSRRRRAAGTHAVLARSLISRLEFSMVAETGPEEAALADEK